MKALGPRTFPKRLNTKPWSTSDLDWEDNKHERASSSSIVKHESLPLSDVTATEKQQLVKYSSPVGTAAGTLVKPEAGGGGQRSTARTLLQRNLVSAGASQEEAASWSLSIESAAWANVEKNFDALGDQDSAEGGLSSTFRLYRAEVRRMSSALKEASVSEHLLSKFRAGEIQPVSLVAMPAEDLLPADKRARLHELRAPSHEEKSRSLPFYDRSMTCNECGKAGSVRYCYLPSARDGFTKAETWGSSANEEKGERCQAECSECLARWHFEL